MTTIKEEAEQYEPNRMKIVSELEEVNINLVLFNGEGLDNNGKIYSYHFIRIGTEEYRVPVTVLKDVKQLLKVRPDMTVVRVTKEGEGLNTRYRTFPVR